jgi:hypothetical protein
MTKDKMMGRKTMSIIWIQEQHRPAGGSIRHRMQQSIANGHVRATRQPGRHRDLPHSTFLSIVAQKKEIEERRRDGKRRAGSVLSGAYSCTLSREGPRCVLYSRQCSTTLSAAHTFTGVLPVCATEPEPADRSLIKPASLQ